MGLSISETGPQIHIMYKWKRNNKNKMGSEKENKNANESVRWEERGREKKNVGFFHLTNRFFCQVFFP